MSDVEHLFSFVSHLYVFFGEMSVLVFSPLFDWVVCFSGIELYELLVYFGREGDGTPLQYSCLYILETNPLSVVSFAIIFSHSESCLSTWLIVSFSVQKLLSLIRSHLSTFVFIPLL